MSKKIYLVDGSGYIFRAFFAIAPLKNHKGLPTNALFGFLRMFGKLLREEKPEYIAVTFDRPEPTFRHELYAEYKANRDECPADLVPQLPHFRTLVSAMGIPALEKPGVEADDIIATLAKKYSAEGHEVVVVSGDKDLLQLVGSGVSVFDAMKDARFSDDDSVRAKLGVPASLVADYLAIVGDTSDNVPGIKGVGPKTASAVLDHFGSLDALLENPSKIAEIPGLRGAKSVGAKFESSHEVLRLSRKLVGLDVHVEPFASSKLEDFHWAGISRGELRALCDEFEFRSGFDAFVDFPAIDSGSAPLAASGSGSLFANEDPRYRGKQYTLISPSDVTSVDASSPEASERLSVGALPRISFESFLEKLRQVPKFAFDTETTALDVLAAELVGLSFSWESNTAWYLPVSPEGDSETYSYQSVLPALQQIFADKGKVKVGYNLKYDIGILSQHGVEVSGPLFDSMIAEHLLHPDRRVAGLKGLTKVYLQEEMLTYEDLMGEEEDIRKIPLDTLTRYAAHDADASWGLFQTLLKKLGGEMLEGHSAVDEIGPHRVFEEIEMPLIPILSRMERTGVYLDVHVLESLELEFSTLLKDLELKIHGLAGREFNINSPKQLAGILFEELALPTKGVKKNQSGYSTDYSVLELLQNVHPIARELLEYREIHKLYSTYVLALRRLVHPITHRVHTSFNQAVAATGRLSSTDPNLQNIPIRNERGRKIRRAFAAAPGFTLIAADYSQIELRVLAHLSGDENLRQAFHSGEDIHQRTADELFGRDLALTAEEKKERRRIAKTINFGVVYGMGAFRLSGDLGVSRREAQSFIDGYFSRYPKVAQYFEMQEKTIDTVGYTETLFGRRRFVSDIDSSSRDSGFAKRALLNAPIQGTAAEIIKRAMILLAPELHERNQDVRMVLQVHDELVFEVREGHEVPATEIIRQKMEGAVTLTVPLVVEVRHGSNWGDAI